jgi:hypothetical protein
LVGPEQELKSGQLDAINGRITLPLYKGYITGTKIPVWYILTDVSDQGQAASLGLNFSAGVGLARSFAGRLERDRPAVERPGDRACRQLYNRNDAERSAHMVYGLR